MRLTSHKDLWRSKSSRRKNDSTRIGSYIDGTRVATIEGRLDLNSSDTSAFTNNPLHSRVRPAGKIISLARRHQIRPHGPSTLTTREHEWCVAKGLRFLGRDIVEGDGRPSGGLQAIEQYIGSLLVIKLSIGGGGCGSRDSREHAVRGSLHVGRLPSLGEVVVPVNGIWLEIVSTGFKHGI